MFNTAKEIIPDGIEIFLIKIPSLRFHILRWSSRELVIRLPFDKTVKDNIPLLIVLIS